MRQRTKASSRLANARSRKAKTLKVGRHSSSSASGQETEVARLTRELNEAREQQTATADVLKVISRSTFDLKAVLDTLVESAARLCDAYDAGIFLRDKESLIFGAHHGPIPQDVVRRRLSRTWTNGRAVVDRKPVHVLDLTAAGDEFPEGRADALRLGHRTILSLPLLREDDAIGSLSLRRTEARLFTEKQIEFATTFADQAVVAIENTRLLSELRQRSSDLTESLQQQTATSKVLEVISRSTFDLQTVLDTLTASATRLCQADKGAIMRWDGDVYRLASNYGFSREGKPYALAHPLRPEHGSVTGRVALEGRPIHVPDVLADPEYQAAGYQQVFGYRTLLGVPLLRERTTIGTFQLARDEVNPFTEKQIELVTTFADQAVIAIENARLLNELRQSLQQQTATADVLKIISRSAFDLRTVLQTLVESAARLCDADKASIIRERDGAFYRAEAYGFSRE